MKKIRELGERLGIGPTCEAFGIPRASYYRWLEPAARGDRRHSPRALSAWERAHVLEVLRSREYVDKSPAAVYAGLLDDGMYLCSERTMYRLLSKHGEIRERRRQLQHPVYTRPELLATGPNELWSWDITRLKGPVKWCRYTRPSSFSMRISNTPRSNSPTLLPVISAMIYLRSADSSDCITLPRSTQHFRWRNATTKHGTRDGAPSDY